MRWSFINMRCPPVVSAVFLKTFFINYLALLSGSTSPAENENALELSFTTMKKKTWQHTAWNDILSDIWPSSSPVVLLQDKVCAGWDISWLIFPLCGRGMEWVNYFYVIFFPLPQWIASRVNAKMIPFNQSLFYIRQSNLMVELDWSNSC